MIYYTEIRGEKKREKKEFLQDWEITRSRKGKQNYLFFLCVSPPLCESLRPKL